jgi:voltage-gated potassium channel
MSKVDNNLGGNFQTSNRVLEVVLLLINLFSCALFVLEISYNSAPPKYLHYLDLSIATVFLIEYIIRFIFAPNKLKYVFSIYGLVDLLSILPSFLPLGNFKFLRALKVLRILKFLRFLETEEFFFGRISKLNLQVIRAIFLIFTVLFVFAGLIFFFESSKDGATIKSFGDSFYFCVVTLSTVGYGDLTPITAAARWSTVCMIFMGAILVPYQASRIIRLIRGGGKNYNIVCKVCGLVGHDEDASHCKACGAVIYNEYLPEE